MLSLQACACSVISNMGRSKSPALSIQRVATLSLAAGLAALSGCYVVPIDARTGQPAVAAPPPYAAPPGPVTVPVRLYPTNEQAGRYGVINASVTNDLHGKGSFNANINGEAFVGEATRKADASRSGIANGAGNRGSYLMCGYTMNSATQGTGQCRLSDGAVFVMHLGN
ncbi:MAG: hypothetical protein QM750_01225 [Rubrivivax sp.]